MLYKKEWYSGNTTFLWNNTQGVLIKNWEGQGKKNREDAYSPTGDIFLRDTAISSWFNEA